MAGAPIDPHDVARESYLFWREKGLDHLHACAWLGNEDGETSFRLGVVGDHGEAFGPAQHHLPRIKQIMKGTGIDMKSASHFDQLRGIYWEVTEGPYKAVWPAFVATNSMVEAIAVLVRRFEQSGSQERDIRRRTNLGNYWLHEFAGLA
jgi:hypothetical protein